MHFDITSALNLISTIAIVSALNFTGLQVRPANRARADQAAVMVIQRTQNASWIDSLALISTLPEEAEPAQIDEAGKAMEAAIFTFNLRLETVGYMVYCRTATPKAIDDLIGGTTMVYWLRAKKWIRRYREVTNNPKMGERSDWLGARPTARRAST